MHLRRSRIRKGTVRCPVGVGRNDPPPPCIPSTLCPAQRWRPWACSGRTTQSPREGAGGAEGVRSPRVIANSKEGGREELVAEGVKVTILLGCWAIKTS